MSRYLNISISLYLFISSLYRSRFFFQERKKRQKSKDSGAILLHIILPSRSNLRPRRNAPVCPLAQLVERRYRLFLAVDEEANAALDVVELVLVANFHERRIVFGVLGFWRNLHRPAAFAFFFARIDATRCVRFAIGQEPCHGTNEFLLFEDFDKRRAKCLEIGFAASVISGPTLLTRNVKIIRVFVGIDVDGLDRLHIVANAHEVGGIQTNRRQPLRIPIKSELCHARLVQFLPLEISRELVIELVHHRPTDDLIVDVFGIGRLLEEVEEQNATEIDAAIEFMRSDGMNDAI